MKTIKARRSPEYAAMIARLPPTEPYSVRFERLTKPINPSNKRDDGVRAIFVSSHFDDRFQTRAQAPVDLLRSMTNQATKRILQEHHDQSACYFVVKESPVEIDGQQNYVGFPLYWIEPRREPRVQIALRNAHQEYYKLTAGVMWTYLSEPVHTGRLKKKVPDDVRVSIATASTSKYMSHLSPQQALALAHFSLRDVELEDDEPFVMHCSVSESLPVSVDVQYDPTTQNACINDVIGQVIFL